MMHLRKLMEHLNMRHLLWTDMQPWECTSSLIEAALHQALDVYIEQMGSIVW